MQRIVILNPDDSDPDWARIENARIVTMPDWWFGFDVSYTPEQREVIDAALNAANMIPTVRPSHS